MNTTRRWVFAAGLTGIILLSILHGVSLGVYPPATCDEAFYAQGAIRYTSALTNGRWWPQAGIFFYLPHGRTYWALLGSMLAIFGQRLVAGRLLSLAGYAAVVAATYYVGKRFISQETGLWAAGLVAVAWVSFYAGHVARPDILAGAASIASIGLAHLARERKQGWITFVFGLLSTLQLDIHPLGIYLIIPLIVIMVVWLVWDGAIRHIAYLLGGIVVGTICIMLLHFGPFTPSVVKTILADPFVIFRNQNVGSMLDGGLGQANSGSGMWLVRFWWRYYFWFTHGASIPQGVMFTVGLVWAVINPHPDRRALALLALASNVVFGIVNTNYTAPPGYAMLWLPLYMILGTSVILDVFKCRINVPFLTEISLATVIFSVLGLVYVSGDIYLAYTHYQDRYTVSAQKLLASIETPARVMTSAEWWYGMHEGVIFVDENLVGPVNTGIWWNAVPLAEQENLPTMALPIRDWIDAEDASQGVIDMVRYRLRPDYVIEDGQISCLATKVEPALALTEFIQQTCVVVDQFTLGPYGTQVVYECEWPDQ
jgi:4-amino-4-deoxy-L-arabinose transferase-like glycosyltransferase